MREGVDGIRRCSKGREIWSASCDWGDQGGQFGTMDGGSISSDDSLSAVLVLGGGVYTPGLR